MRVGVAITALCFSALLAMVPAASAATTYPVYGSFQETQIDSVTENPDGTYTIQDEGDTYGSFRGHWVYWTVVNTTSMTYTAQGLFYASLGGRPAAWIGFMAWGQYFDNGTCRELDVPSSAGYSGWIYFSGPQNPLTGLSRGQYYGQLTK